MSVGRLSRCLIALLLLVGFIPLFTLSANAEPPSNDDFEDATAIIQLPFAVTVDASEATKQNPEFGGCSTGNHSVWYSFTAPAAMRISVTTSGRDLIEAIIRADGDSLICDKDVLETRLDLSRGQTIYFRLAHHPLLTDIEPWTLRVREVIKPTNDSIANATVLDGHRIQTRADLDFSSAGYEDPRCGPVGAKTVWYRYVADRDRLIQASSIPVLELGPVVHLSAYTQQDGSLNPLGCARSEIYLHASLGLELERGEEVLFMVGVAPSVEEATVAFSMRGGTRPANDDYANAETIPLLPLDGEPLPPPFAHPTAIWATSAEDDPEDSARCPVVPAETIWYTYTAIEPISLRVGAASANGPNRLLAYQGARGALTTIACDEQRAGGQIVLNLAEGQTVHLLAWCCMAVDRMSLHADARPLSRARNDTRRTAVNISQVRQWTPFIRTKDASTATSLPSDPECEGSRRTLWYRYTPTRTMRVEATTAASNYDTSLSVYRGRDLSKIACVNDNLPADTSHVGQWQGSGHVAEGVSFRAIEGKTYFIMVGALDRASILRFALSKAD